MTLALCLAVAAGPAPDFNRDVRPILSNHCYKCHGPGTQKAGVRLDTHAFAVKKGAVVPGKPDESAIIDRVATPGDDRMPPPEGGPALTPAQVATLRAWVAAGAPYAPHWAFVPPARPPLPVVTDPTANPIDLFVRARLAAAGLTPSPEADRPTLLRRVTLDLVGLLPSPGEVDAFVTDPSPDAYEKVVARLLASPHYGERQARHWLDLARYADSNGFTVDSPRTIWPYRDWVIRAYNADLPFDRFTRDQLAGDLVPQPTTDQLVATGFHRNTPLNQEGGADPEQFRVERTLDRASTTATVWLGLTAACAQCHDHKFDPVSQADFYRLYAFFNSCDEPVLPVGGPPELADKLNDLNRRADERNAAGDLKGADKLRAEAAKLEKGVPTTLVLRERAKPRETFVHVRGDFLRRGEPVRPGYPAALTPERPPTIVGGRSRLHLSEWLTSPGNPLTARVTANREWQKFFGTGLVATENDFGMQGDAPTHPELLDYLAVEFRQAGWRVKHLHRLIVTSATYRQASAHRPDLAAADPLNKLLGRQNRLRLEAEIIRDAALTASGKLTRTMFGPGVYPPAPPEIFALTQNKKPWPTSTGPDRFRRGIYTVIYRQSQHHLLTTFDGADAQTACTRRTRSNTPLQALHLANDPAFVELAAALGERLQREAAGDAGRVRHAFRLCFGRYPSPAEAGTVRRFLDAQRAADPATAWAQVARVLLNTDEFITRE
jgi:hypothetical protein